MKSKAYEINKYLEEECECPHEVIEEKEHKHEHKKPEKYKKQESAVDELEKNDDKKPCCSHGQNLLY